MTWTKSYGHFAAAYGTCWLILLAAALVSQTHIDTGLFGLLGFPVVGCVYALYRRSSGDSQGSELQELKVRVKLLESRLTSLQRDSRPPADGPTADTQ